MQKFDLSVKNISSQDSLSVSKEQLKMVFDFVENQKVDIRILEWAGFLSLENREWTIAENIFSSLLEQRNKVSDWLGLAKALRKQSRWEEAESCYLEALHQINEPCSLLFIVYKALGGICVLKEDFPMAEEYYNKASTLNPSCSSLIFHRAMMYFKEKNYSSAEKHFKNFVQVHPLSAKAWLGLALARKALGDEELALACLERSIDIQPQNSQALLVKKRWCPSLSELLSNALNFSV